MNREFLVSEDFFLNVCIATNVVVFGSSILLPYHTELTPLVCYRSLPPPSQVLANCLGGGGEGVSVLINFFRGREEEMG